MIQPDPAVRTTKRPPQPRRCRVLLLGWWLPTLVMFGSALGQPAANPPATQPSAGSPSSSVTPASQMLDQMLRSPANSGSVLKPGGDMSGGQDNASPGHGAASGAPTSAVPAVIREGSFIVDRTGRLTRSADGSQFEFTFDSDGRALKDPPVVILPNMKLMAMENAVSASNRDLRFRITGMVTEYRGRNYVLLEKVVVVPDVVQQGL